MDIQSEFKKCKIEFLHDSADLYPYAFDTAPVGDEIILPEFVLFPKTTLDVQNIVKIAHKYNKKIISRGAGTCHTSGAKPCRNSLVIHFSKMNKILEINKENLTAIVQSGVIVGQLQNEVDHFGLFFPPDPSNLKVSTIGGAIALSSGGARAFKYGTTKDYVINLEVVLPESGDVIETAKDVAKNVTGYNLTQLFVGSEGTLGIITKATLKLIPKPEKKSTTMAYFNSLNDAGCAVNNIIDSNIFPSTIDLIDKNTISTIEKFNPQGWEIKEAMLLIELDGGKFQIEEDNKKLFDVLKKSDAIKIVQAKDEIQSEKIWDARRSAFACCTKLKPNVITEDVVVPRSNIVPLINIINDLSKTYNLTVCVMGHAGDGNIHPNFALDLSDENEYERFKIVKNKLFEAAIKLGGTLSGEHGIGIEKKEFLPLAVGDNVYKIMEKIKFLFDPNCVLNPDLLFKK